MGKLTLDVGGVLDPARVAGSIDAKKNMKNRLNNSIFAVVSIGGALLLFIGTYFHPMDADPSASLVAFAEYAADRHWIASHLIQLSGAALMIAALVLLGSMLLNGRARALAAVGIAGAVASLAVAAVLQAVDGIALKTMTNAWFSAPEAEKGSLFHAALAVRQIETGLASVASLLFGLTASLFGIALWIDRRFPVWLGVLAVAGGVSTAIAGVAMAYTGFSELTMAINMPANIVLLLWIVSLGLYVGSTKAITLG